MTLIVTNAFSLNMLNVAEGDLCNIRCYRLSTIRAAFLAAHPSTRSAVGHADTAAVFSTVLGSDIPCNRATITLNEETSLLVGQYRGPRLEEGTKVLPEGATIEWYRVTMTRSSL